jgi:hypothetical protein
MLHDAFHRLVFPVITSLIIGTVWVVGWSSDLQAQADRKYWPALEVPSHSVKATPVETTPIETTPVETTPVETTPVNGSLQQVLLKDN